MRETNCVIHWIEVYPVDSVIQQLGPVFVYDRADFSLIVGSQCVGFVLLLGSLSKDVFDQRTSTGSEDFSLVICLDAMQFVLLSFFTLIETI